MSYVISVDARERGRHGLSGRALSTAGLAGCPDQRSVHGRTGRRHGAKSRCRAGNFLDGTDGMRDAFVTDRDGGFLVMGGNHGGREAVRRPVPERIRRIPGAAVRAHASLHSERRHGVGFLREARAGVPAAPQHASRYDGPARSIGGAGPLIDGPVLRQRGAGPNRILSRRSERRRMVSRFPDVRTEGEAFTRDLRARATRPV